MHVARGSAAGGVVDTDAWALDALARLGRLPDVARVGLALSEGGGRRLRFTASDRVPGPDWCHVDAYDDVPLNTAIRTGEPVLGSLADLAAAFSTFTARQQTRTKGVAAVPIVGSGQALGGFVLFFQRAQSFDVEQRVALEVIGTELGDTLRQAQRRDARRGARLADVPVPAGARVAAYDVPPEPTAVAHARRFVRATLSDWDVDPATIDDAVLCLDELVTNALVHTHAGSEVQVLLEGGVLTATVRDWGMRSAVPEPDDDPLRVHGRGLQIVAAVADRWGSRLDEAGATVWFTLEVGDATA